MIKINQTVVDKEIGNCMQAVLASLFEKPLEETINIIDYLPCWAIPFMEWVESIGYEYEGVMSPAKTIEESYKDLKEVESVGGYFFASVPSKNFDGTYHAVVMDADGVVIHDPSPEKQWEGVDIISSGDVEYWYLFKRAS